MSQKILGIDLGTHSVKLALLERQFDDYKVLNFYQQELDLHSRLSHEDSVRIALEQILAKNIIEPDIVSVSLPGHIASARILEIPVGNSKKVNQIVPFELENFIPVDIDDLHFDFYTLSHFETESSVLTTYTKRNVFENYLSALQSVNLDPKYFGIDVVDLAALGHFTLVSKDHCYAICDIGHSKTNICIMEGGKLRYVRTIGIGGLHFTRAIQRSYNLNYDKAESLKLSRAKVSTKEEGSDQISRVIHHIAQDLVSAMKQTFLAYESNLSNQRIAAVYITGGCSRLGGLQDFLSFHLRKNVLEIDPFAMINYSGIEDTESTTVVAAQALSSAIKPVLSNVLPKINLRKNEFGFKQDLELITKELKTIGIGALVLLLLGIGYYFYANQYYSKKMARVDRAIEKIIKRDFSDMGQGSSRRRKKPNSSGIVSKYYRRAKSRLKDLKTQMREIKGEDDVSVLQIMEEISTHLPEKNEVQFSVNEFDFSKDFVRIRANTDKALNTQRIVEALSESKVFPENSIVAKDPKSKASNVWEFELTINMKNEK